MKTKTKMVITTFVNLALVIFLIWWAKDSTGSNAMAFVTAIVCFNTFLIVAIIYGLRLIATGANDTLERLLDLNDPLRRHTHDKKPMSRMSNKSDTKREVHEELSDSGAGSGPST